MKSFQSWKRIDRGRGLDKGQKGWEEKVIIICMKLSKNQHNIIIHMKLSKNKHNEFFLLFNYMQIVPKILNKK